MKYLLIIGLFISVLCGCNSGNSHKLNRTDSTMVTVDSCEYVVFTFEWNEVMQVVHHGNCHNPIHEK
jgi:hypothetical protein